MYTETSKSYNESLEMVPPPKIIPEEFRAKVLSFIAGDTEAFETPGLIDVTADYILGLYHNGDMGQALILLEQLGGLSIQENNQHREQSLIVLSLIAEKILEENIEDLLEAVANMLMRWLKGETEYHGGFEYICLQLSKLLQRMLEKNLWYQAESLVSTLSEINNDSGEKNRLLSRVITRIHSRLAESNLLDELLATYVDETSDKSDVAGTILLHLGDKSGSAMLGTLSTCENREQRFRLLSLIPEAGESIKPSLIQGLKNTPSWYFARNLIYLITRIADPELFVHVEPFMKHNDLRVQEEVIRCASKINQKGLLKALNVCDDKLKPDLIRLLGPMGGKKIGESFSGLLANYTVFEPHLQDSIIQGVCSHLIYYPEMDVTHILENLLEDYDEFRHFSKETVEIIEATLKSLQENSLNQNNPAIEITSAASADISAAAPWFEDVLGSGEISPELKMYLRKRSNFTSSLSYEEWLVFSALLIHRTYQEGDSITALGDMNSNLYFVEEGKIKIDFPDDEQEAYLKSGDIFGHEIFMNGSEWTVSVVAASKAELFIFDQEQLLSLQPSYPGLCQKILNYCKSKYTLL